MIDFKKLDFGIELGGIMYNRLFMDLMLLNFFSGVNNYPLFHLQTFADKKTRTILFELLFFIKFSVVREVV